MILISYIKFKKVILINNAFTLLWGIGIILSIIYSTNNKLVIPSSNLIIMVMIVILVFNAFYFFLTPKKFFTFDIANEIYVNNQMIKILFWIALILYMPNIINSLLIIAKSGLNFSLIRTLYLDMQVEGNGIYVYITKIIPNGIMNSLSIISAYYLTKKNLKLAKYGIILVGLSVLCFGGRNSILTLLESYIISFCLLKEHTKKKLKLQKRYIIIVIGIIIVLTFSRGLNGASFIDMIGTYFIQQFSFMQYILNNAGSYGIGELHYGYLSLGFIFAPFILIFSLFFNNIKLPSYYFDIYAQNTINLSIQRNVLKAINNNTTSLYNFILDFGMHFYYLGVILYALIICIAQYNFKKNPNIGFNFFLLVYIYQTVLNSTINYSLTNITVSFTLFFLYVLTRKFKFRFSNFSNKSV